MKNEWKIREMLDVKKYHLCTSNTGEWSLYRYYDDFEKYMSEDNKAIMTSETHTEKDLLKFAKEHRVIDFERYNSMFRIVLCYINLFICIIGIALDSNFLRGANWTLNILIIIWAVIDLIIGRHNFKIRMEELNEKIKEQLKQIEDKLNKIGGDNENI